MTDDLCRPGGITWINKDEKSSDGVPLGAPGAKLDAGKPEVLTLCLDYFPDALAAVAGVSAAGIRKGYAAGSWHTVNGGIARYGDALVRHLLAEGRAGTFTAVDPQTGVLHAAAAAWNALARLQLIIEAMRDDNAAFAQEILDNEKPVMPARDCQCDIKIGGTD